MRNTKVFTQMTDSCQSLMMMMMVVKVMWRVQRSM